MQFAPRALPCIVCKTTLVKTGGKTGMCSACRTARPDIANTQRANRAKIRASLDAWVTKNTVPVPGRTDIRRVNPDALFGKKGK